MAIPRLLYGYLSQSSSPINMSVPWTISNRDGAFKMNYSQEEAVRTNLLVWAKTNWGERPMRFRFGLDAKRHLFNPAPIVKEALKTNASEQLATFFPFLEIDTLDVLTWEDDVDIPEHVVVFKLEAHFVSDDRKKIKISEEIGL